MFEVGELIKKLLVALSLQTRIFYLLLNICES
jgi:hypothetical protein